MNRIWKISGILLFTLIGATVSGQSIKCDTKKTFPTNNRTSLNLVNKYGDINIMTVESDSITICSTITINQDNKELMLKNSEFITINIIKSENKISVSTQFDDRFFSSTYRKGRQSFTVDYLIELPPYVNLNITNSFGNISIGELSGLINIKLSNGNLFAKRLTRANSQPVSKVDVNHGNISIDEVSWISITAQLCPDVYIGNAQALLMISDFSKINIGSVSSLVTESKSDSYSIESIKNLVSESVYSSFEIETLYGKLKSNTVLGSLTVYNLKKEFSSIDITSINTPVIIETGAELSFKTDLTGIKNPIDFSYEDSPGIINSESYGITTYKGIAGNNKETASMIKIHATNGKLTIR